MLGSSKRSLADTSVTSTADLSIFSGGEHRHTALQRMNNENGNINDPSAMEIFNYSDFDLNKNVKADKQENGESSPE